MKIRGLAEWIPSLSVAIHSVHSLICIVIRTVCTAIIYMFCLLFQVVPTGAGDVSSSFFFCFFSSVPAFIIWSGLTLHGYFMLPLQPIFRFLLFIRLHFTSLSLTKYWPYSVLDYSTTWPNYIFHSIVTSSSITRSNFRLPGLIFFTWPPFNFYFYPVNFAFFSFSCCHQISQLGTQIFTAPNKTSPQDGPVGTLRNWIAWTKLFIFGRMMR